MTVRSKILLTSFFIAAVVGGLWTVSLGRKAADGMPMVVQTQVESPEATVAAAAAQPPTPSLVDDISTRVCEAAMQFQDAVERQAFLGNAVKGVPRALYGRIIEKLNLAAPDSVQAEFVRAILLRWAFEEATNVAAWALNNPGHAYRQEALALAAQRWAQANPAQLLQWSAGLTAEDRQWVLLRSGDYLGRTDPALFAVWRQAIQPGRERDQLELVIAREWAQRDPESLAAALAENQGPEFDDWRRLTVIGLTNQLANMDGAEAARFVAERIPPGPAQRGAVMGAVVAWARQDPASAKNWIETFTSTELRTEASQVLISYWLERDSSAAQAYAQSLPAGPVGDRASERVAQFLVDKNADVAVSWAERIIDPGLRSQTLAFVLSEWERRDPDAVLSLLRERPELASIAPSGG